MKFRILILFVASLALASCGSSTANSHTHGDGSHIHEDGGNPHSHEGDAAATAGETHQGGKEYTSAYICPMHCEGSGSDQPGACPVCGMDYVARAEHIKDGHGH